MAKRTKPKEAPRQSEKCLQYLCQQWLEKSGLWGRILIFHVPNERRGGIGAVMHFKRMGVRPGVADYLVFTSRDAAIELKEADGKQRKDQERFQRQWEATGKSYFVVRTLDEFQGVMAALTLFC
jgi:hypothetical protein